jgi:hypothetical protein
LSACQAVRVSIWVSSLVSEGKRLDRRLENGMLAITVERRRSRQFRTSSRNHHQIADTSKQHRLRSGQMPPPNFLAVVSLEPTACSNRFGALDSLDCSTGFSAVDSRSSNRSSALGTPSCSTDFSAVDNGHSKRSAEPGRRLVGSKHWSAGRELRWIRQAQSKSRLLSARLPPRLRGAQLEVNIDSVLTVQ